MMYNVTVGYNADRTLNMFKSVLAMADFNFFLFFPLQFMSYLQSALTCYI